MHVCHSAIRLTACAVVVARSRRPAPAAAQDFRGSIAGTITDASGGVLPGVTVTVTNADTGVSQTSSPTSRGLYQVLVSERRRRIR